MTTILSKDDIIPISNSVTTIRQTPTPTFLEKQTYATYRKNIILHDVIKGYSQKEKRKIDADIKSTTIPITVDTFFPSFGLTTGEYCTFATITKTKDEKRGRKTHRLSKD